MSKAKYSKEVKYQYNININRRIEHLLNMGKAKYSKEVKYIYRLQRINYKLKRKNRNDKILKEI